MVVFESARLQRTSRTTMPLAEFGQLRDQRLDPPEDVDLVVTEVVEERAERGVDEPQLILRQLDGLHT